MKKIAFGFAIIFLMTFVSSVQADELSAACQPLGRATCIPDKDGCAYPFSFRCGKYSFNKFLLADDYTVRGNASGTFKVSAIEVNVVEKGKVQFIILKNPPGNVSDYYDMSANQWIKDQLKMKGVSPKAELKVTNLLFKAMPEFTEIKKSAAPVSTSAQGTQ
jgi:hypothetical protein